MHPGSDWRDRVHAGSAIFADESGARFALAGGLALALGVTLFWSLASVQNHELLTPDWFLEMLSRLRTSENRLLPSWWLSSGLLEAARSGWRDDAVRAALTESVLFLAVMISNALVLHQIAVWTAGWTYRDGYSVLCAEHTGAVRHKPAWIDRALGALLQPLGTQLRLLIIKDVRLFRRDPVQWSQFLIFFGFLALYFLNTRRLSYDVNYITWVNIISFLNLAVVGLILSTFTTRFIFPMISLEGRRFWILGRLPVGRDMILWSKFLFAALGSLVPCMTLIVLSDLMLGVSHLVIWVHMLACVLLCSGLSGIAVGLGAKMPNLREDSPAHRGRLWRHAEPGIERCLHRGAGRDHDCAQPFLFTLETGGQPGDAARPAAAMDLVNRWRLRRFDSRSRRDNRPAGRRHSSVSQAEA